MDIAERQPYREASYGINPTELPSQEQIDRVLKPFQTAHERNTAVQQVEAFCLRTCYAPEFAETAANLMYGMEDLSSTEVLDNEALYDIGEDWGRIIRRIPSMCDKDLLQVRDPLDTNLYEPPTDESKKLLWDAGMAEVVRVYLIDKQTLQEKRLTVMWLDCHGECVWWNKIDRDNLLELSGDLSDGRSILEWSWSGGDGSQLEKGSLIDWV